MACNLTPYGKTFTSQKIAVVVGTLLDNAKWPGGGISSPPNLCEVPPGSFGTGVVWEKPYKVPACTLLLAEA